MVGPEYWNGFRNELEKLAYVVAKLEEPRKNTPAQEANC
jgi:hypothetical protein